MYRYIAICSAVLAVAAGVVVSATGQTAPSAPASAPHKPTIYLVGDSTVKNGRDDGSNGQWGWGHILHYYFDESKVVVENDAVGGTSSRTFFQTANMWPRVAAKLQAGDYVLMQFGHNDNTRPPESDTLRYRSTISGNGEETVQGPKDASGAMETIHSFGWYERQMIAQTKDKKATPVVCSLIPRNSWSGDKINRADKSYGLWAKQAAEQGGAAFLPLNTLIADQYDKLGKEKVTAEMFPQGEATHTNWAGAALNAKCVAEGIKGLKDVPLKEFMKENPVVPEKADVQAGAGRGAAPGAQPPRIDLSTLPAPGAATTAPKVAPVNGDRE